MAAPQSARIEEPGDDEKVHGRQQGGSDFPGEKSEERLESEDAAPERDGAGRAEVHKRGVIPLEGHPRGDLQRRGGEKHADTPDAPHEDVARL